MDRAAEVAGEIVEGGALHPDARRGSDRGSRAKRLRRWPFNGSPTTAPTAALDRALLSTEALTR